MQKILLVCTGMVNVCRPCHKYTLYNMYVFCMLMMFIYYVHIQYMLVKYCMCKIAEGVIVNVKALHLCMLRYIFMT